MQSFVLPYKLPASQTSLSFFAIFLQGFTEQQLGLVEDNTAMIEEREKEITNIVQSIHDLNEIFRDLANLIVEQVWCKTS